MRTLLILTLLFPLLAAAAPDVDEPHAVVFMYHRFGEDPYPSTSVRLAQFEAQLDWLARNGYRVRPLREIVTALERGEPLPERTVAITVDDAYLSVYREAYPRLKARGWPFTVFVSSEPVDQGLRGTMSWDQMRQMQAAGVAFANHGASHDYLARRRPDEDQTAWLARVRADIEQGQRRLREELGEAVETLPRLFAWPYGEYSLELAALLAELGYTGFGQHSGALGPHADRRALPRYPVAEDYAALDDFALKAASLPLPVLRAEPAEPRVGDNPPRLVLHLGESEADLTRLACYASGQGRIPHRLEGDTLTLQAPRPLPEGRGRYNCTAPHRQGKRWYWFSQPWLVGR